MNKEAFKQVLKIAEKSERARTFRHQVFDFSRWFYDRTGTHKTAADVVKHPCGTVACIGGWGSILQLAKENPEHEIKQHMYPDADGMLEEACKFFDISDMDGEYLFNGHWHTDDIEAPQAHVIAKLKNIIETGKVINPDFDARYQ